MSDWTRPVICDWIPDDPICIPPVIEDTTTDTTTGTDTTDGTSTGGGTSDTAVSPEEQIAMTMEGMYMAMASPLQGQLAYTAVAAFVTAHVALSAFRYKPFASYYTDGDTIYTTTNWWKLSAQIGSYGALGLYGLATLTQLLSLFGVASETNVLVWQYGVGIAGMVVKAAAGILLAIAYEQAWTISQDGANANQATAATVLAEIEQGMIEKGALEASSTFTLYSQYENWMAAQWAGFSEETKAKYQAQQEAEQ